MKIFRLFVVATGLTLCWQLIVTITGAPHYILPGPLAVVAALFSHFVELLGHLQTTLTEIVLGLVLGTVFGTSCALSMIVLPGLKRWMLPVLVASQAIPVFALAPVLVLWLGYGLASKVAMTVLIIFFPVCSSFYYGMQRVNPDLLELARIMDAGPVATLRLLIIPSALPSFASGIRVAAAVAPIGAVVGEWVGSSSGLGYYMLHANARMQIDVMFAALTLLSLSSVTMYYVIDCVLCRLVFWENTKEVLHEMS